MPRHARATGRADEAKQQYQHGRRLLKESGKEGSALLFQALRGAPGRERASLSAASVPVPAELPAAPSGTQADLVGREDEWTRLTEAFATTLSSRCNQFMLVSGVAGIGKSRLLEACSAHVRAAGAYLLEASAFESEQPRPLGLWLDAFQRHDPEASIV